jgi:hypothetical protein
VLSSVASSAVTDSSATITWLTDELADTQVDYGTTASYGTASTLNTTLTKSHSVVLSNLAGGTTYHYRVKSRDGFGNLAVSGDYVFTTTGTSISSPPPGSASWPYRKKLTIDHTKVSGVSSAVLSNFPVLISMTDPDLKKAGKTDGSDILFRDSSGNKLNHELERFDPTTGQLVAWVQIPQLSATSDTSFYVYYGNPSATDQQNIAGAWDSGFQAVLHLADSPSAATFKDSTGKGIWTSSVNSLSAGAGQIGGALNFGGKLVGPDIAAVNAAPQLTYSAWINPATLTGMMSIISKSSTGPNTVQLGMGGQGYGGTKNGSLVGMLNNNPTGYGTQAYGYTGPVLSVGAWTYVTMVFDGGQNGNAGRLKIYMNGAPQPLTFGGTIPPNTSNFAKNIAVASGSYPGSCVDCLTFKGAIDEVRVSSVARNSDWIRTEYNNQNNPGAFMSMGSEEAVSSAQSLSISPATLPAGTVGVAYSTTIVTATPGVSPYTWSAVGLPPGLNLNAGTGTISGTPTTATGSPFGVTVTVTDSSSATATKTYSLIVNTGNTSATSAAVSASFVQVDDTTQGSWKAVYGADGAAIYGDIIKYPSYAQVVFSGQNGYWWNASTADVRALQKFSQPDRIASTWFSFTNFTIDVNLTDGNTHQVALYCLDWDTPAARANRIDVLDATTKAVLDTRTTSGFVNGRYLVWNLKGHVILRVTNVGQSNAVVSGLFFGGSSPSQ